MTALPAAEPGREIASGPVPWRHLVPRMTPMMIGYFCQGWTGWLYVTWMPSLFSKNYGLDLKKSSLFYAGTLFCAMIAELLGGVVTDYLLRRTQSLQIARSLLIAVSWVLAVASLVPAILAQDFGSWEGWPWSTCLWPGACTTASGRCRRWVLRE